MSKLTGKLEGKVALVTGASKGIRASITKHLAESGAVGLLRAVKEAVKHFGAEGGSCVNISSVASTAAPPNASVYSPTTKAAVDALTRSLAKELRPRSIRVNAINPGMVETEGFRTAGLAAWNPERSRRS